MLVAVNYHYIRETFDAPYPSIFGVTPEQFSRQLDLLGRSASFVGIDDIADNIDGKRSVPARSAVITFDDGLREQYELAWPILQKKGIPAIFFVNTRPVEEDYVTTTHKIHILRSHTAPDRLLETIKEVLKYEGLTFDLPDRSKAKSVYIYDEPQAAQLKYFINYLLNEKQKVKIVSQCFEKLGFDQRKTSNDLYISKDILIDLSRDGVLGSHGHAHLPLGLLEASEAIMDFETSMKKLNEWTRKTVRTFSYPFGFKAACSKTVAEYAQNKGVKFAFTLERAGNKDLSFPMFLGRFSPNDIFAKNIDDFWNGLTHTVWFQ